MLLNRLARRDTAAMNAGGWHQCLGELDALVADRPGGGVKRPDAQPWRPLYDSYVADGLPSGAPLPDQT